jgi:pimeloyl-ACP methyl ester carboxylesterase
MKNLLLFLSIFNLSSSKAQTKNQIIYGSNPAAGKYIEANDIKVYYETYGEGEPLILLHGGGGSIENFAYQIPELSKYFKVIAIDSRAQGRTSDSKQEITYSLMASDVFALIDKLQIGSVYVLGWSDGGNTGLELAFAHPDKVKKLITSGANYNHGVGSVSDDSVIMDQDNPILVKMKPFIQGFSKNPEKLSPDPGKLPEIKKKIENLWSNFPNFTIDQLKTIKAPTLIISGDHDLESIEQTVTIYRSLPNSQLLIVPGASHLVLMEQSDLLNNLIVKFLQTPFRKINNMYFFKQK